jgi:hypothetical protein
MKHKRTLMKRTQARDHGKELFDTIVFLMILLGVLWYLNI